jgi:hypothetical protein
MVVAAAIILTVPYCLAGESILGVLPTMMQQVLLLAVEMTLAGGVTWKGCSWFIEWMKYKWYRTTDAYLAWWEKPAEEKWQEHLQQNAAAVWLFTETSEKVRFFIQTEGEQETEPSEHKPSEQTQAEQPPAEQDEKQEYTEYETVAQCTTMTDEVEIEGETQKCVVDSGCGPCLFPLSRLRRCMQALKLKPSAARLRAVNGNPLDMRGTAGLNIRIPGTCRSV